MRGQLHLWTLFQIPEGVRLRESQLYTVNYSSGGIIHLESEILQKQSPLQVKVGGNVHGCRKLHMMATQLLSPNDTPTPSHKLAVGNMPI